MNNMRYKILLNDVKYMDNPCIVMRGTTFYHYDHVIDVLHDDILDLNKVYCCCIQKNIFEDPRQDVVIIYLE